MTEGPLFDDFAMKTIVLPPCVFKDVNVPGGNPLSEVDVLHEEMVRAKRMNPRR